MPDPLTPEQRSRLMARVRGKDTKPELLVRSLVHRLGYRFRLHRADLPGKPDMVFSSLAKIIFVHGCFWHGHAKCGRATIPVARREFWERKLVGNKTRDQAVRRKLRRLGWSVLVIWECELKDLQRLSSRVVDFLEG